MRRRREQRSSLGLRLARPIGEEVVNRRARLTRYQLAAEYLRPCNHLVERAQDDCAADILHDLRVWLATGATDMLRGLAGQQRRQRKPTPTPNSACAAGGLTVWVDNTIYQPTYQPQKGPATR